MTQSESRTQSTLSREPVHFLVFSASLRVASLNTRLARLAARTIEDHGGTVDLAAMSEFDAPSYDQEVQERDGFPPGAEAFRRRLEASDAFVIASPEYNFSMPGLLKNTIDWVSRYKPQPFNERHALLISASGAYGRFASRLSTWARGCSRTCFRSRRRIKHSMAMAESSTSNSATGSSAT